METDKTLTAAQLPYARHKDDIKNWQSDAKHTRSLLDTVKSVKPTILIGCSAQTGHFTQEIIKTMASYCERPIIFPLSNPDEKCEAKPFDLLTWTNGRALVATGTAFDMVRLENRIFTIAQCNNALIYPGIGLGIIAVQASRLTADMLWAAAQSLSQLSPAVDDHFLPLLPAIDQAELISKKIALAVAQAAIKAGLAQKKIEIDLEEHINEIYWKPGYLPFNRITEA
jgi:malate dehydrogenase (oxaloacetate-decarboxylating)